MKQSALIIFLAVCAAAVIGSLFAPAEAVEPPPAYTVPAVFSQTAAGGLHTCGVHTDGAVTCRGNDDFGQSTPPDGIFTQVSAGAFHTCGILQSDSSVVCWGDDSLNQITDTPAGSFTQISAGEYYTCGILQSDSSVVCWGDNSYNQITNTPADTFTQVSAGANHACGILQADSSVVCWGYDSSNQVSGTPAGIFTKVEAGGLHACGILQADSSVVCWGSGTTNTGSEPEYGQSMPPAGIFADISSGGYHTCGRLSDQSIVCWGAGTTVGGGPEFGQSIPPGGTFSGISAGRYHTCGVRTDQLVACWGDNSDGQSTMPVYRSAKPLALYIPATADGLGNAAVSVSAGRPADTVYQIQYKKTTDVLWTTSGSTDRFQTITLPSFGTYQFRVKIVDSNGILADSEWTAGNQDCLFTNVAAPSNFSASVHNVGGINSSSQIDLAWDSYVGADSFELQRRGGNCGVANDWTAIASPDGASTSFNNTALSPSKLYAFRIRAIVGGAVSPWVCVTATTPAIPAPSNLANTGTTTTSISLSWQDNSIDESRFTLQRKVGAVCNNSGWTVAAYLGADVTIFADTGLSNGTTYTYRIRANVPSSTSLFSSDWSGCLTVATPALPAPSGLTVTPVNPIRIDLGWTDNSTDEVTFELQRRTNGCGPTGWTTIATLPFDTVSYQDNGVNPGFTYGYQVRATNAGGSSAWSSCVTGTTPALQAPSVLAVTGTTETTVSLSWTDNSTVETSFTIQRKNGAVCDDTGWATVGTVGANVEAFTNTGLPSSTTFSYRTNANVNGYSSAWSNCVSGTTAASTAPPAPADPSGATALGFSAASIRIDWTDNSDNETGFQIQWKSGAVCDNSGWATLTNVAADTVTFQQNNRPANATYIYRVRAFNGTTYSGWSNCITATTYTAATVAPAAPSAIAATPGAAGQVAISWTDNQADTVAAAETLFQLQRKDGAVCDGNGWANVTNTGTDVTAYTNTGLISGNTYSWRVRAANAAGFSAWNACATAVAP